ncbi:MAG TPA: cupin domain-containing protein, partial [Opitutaceae bacterium]|nr:cupin domain-containing protein [Opitutaceae bacterium]
MAGFIRRVVTGHDKDGKAVVLSDGLAPTVKTNPLRPGHRSTDIWKTNSAPVIIKADEPDPTLGPRIIHPAPQGTVIRIAELQPETEETRNMTPERSREIFKAMGNENASMWGRGGRHPLMHRTETIDYAVVLEGEITMVLDDKDVQLKAGDVVIQRGTSHAWSNRSNKPVRMLYVLIDAKFAPELSAMFG